MKDFRVNALIGVYFIIAGILAFQYVSANSSSIPDLLTSHAVIVNDTRYATLGNPRGLHIYYGSDAIPIKAGTLLFYLLSIYMILLGIFILVKSVIW